MNTHESIQAPPAPAEPTPRNSFMRTGPYAPRRIKSSLPAETLPTWEDEGGSLADPPPP